MSHILTFSSEKAPIPFPDPLLHEVSNFVINTSVMNIFSVIVTLLEQNVHFFMCSKLKKQGAKDRSA